MADQNRSRSQIEADLAAARTRLSANLEDLIDQVHPNNVKRRQVDQLKAFASGEASNARAQVQNADGSLRLDRLALVGGSVVGFIVFLAVMRGVVRKGQRSQ